MLFVILKHNIWYFRFVALCERVLLGVVSLPWSGVKIVSGGVLAPDMGKRGRYWAFPFVFRLSSSSSRRMASTFTM